MPGMKKFYLLILLNIIFNLAASAQEYRKFKFGFGPGLTLSGTTYNGEPPTGILLAIEPAYHVSDDWTLGLRFESAYNRFDADLSGPIIFSFTANCQYYFSNGSPRYFLGGGFGIYSVDTNTEFGIYPRLGVDFSHVSLTVDYNIIAASSEPGYSYNYLGIRLGVFIGGGEIHPKLPAQ